MFSFAPISRAPIASLSGATVIRRLSQAAGTGVVGTITTSTAPDATTVLIYGVKGGGKVGQLYKSLKHTLGHSAGVGTVGTVSILVSATGLFMTGLRCVVRPASGGDAMISLDYSDTAGHSWNNSLTQSLGTEGQYATSVQWRRLGYGRSRVFRLTWAGPENTSLLGCFIEVAEGQT